MAGKKKKKRCTRDDEPLPEGEEWVEWGGELIWAAGFTSGGAPYGLTFEEYRQATMEAEPRAGWVRARRILDYVFGAQSDCEAAAIGWVKRLDEGLFRTAFFADVDFHPDAEHESGRYVVLLPRRDVDPGFNTRVRREATILSRLARLSLSFRVPQVAAVFVEQGRPVLVERFVDGIPLDLRAGRQTSVRPWQVVAETAAAIHAVDTDAFNGVLGGHATRREHAEAELEAFDGAVDPLLCDARDWAYSHLPPEIPSVFLHGDLLGQNILLPLLEPGQPNAVIDWERATRGDPAYDLAIVTRGVKRPFQLADGLHRLLDIYAATREVEITASEIHFYELCMAARWYRDSLDENRRVHPPEQEFNRVKGILRRAEASG